MIVGVPKEIKKAENRVGMVPSGVRALTEAGHRVLVQKTAGTGSGFSDDEFIKAGAELKETIEEVYAESEMIVKVKEPLEQEWDLLKENQILFTYLHLAPAKELTLALLKSKCIGIAYETVQLPDGSLPLLTPMSEVAGRVAVQVGAYFLQKEHGGRGVLLGGVPGVAPGNVVIVGGGTVGLNAAKMALGMGARVSILDISLERLRYLDDVFQCRVTTLMSNRQNIEEQIKVADLVIGAVLIPGAKAPHLITREMLSTMKPGAVIVDVAVDQGGCVETIRPTYHDDPVYEVDGICHYGVANMPGAVARTSTFALTNATLPYVLKLANQGFPEAVRLDEPLRKGINVCGGKLHYKAVADALGLEYTPFEI
ncbi:MAG: alanine dehydrogenase [Deltaproteobacteria bacterium]|nr:alanine dehydrogenase [Deltaproteobacteria bacterium]MBW2303057.1 alanine dehydrogenase [Deltaproteobacteria bacterium]